jgi:histidyl-tRNA synthetase
METLGGPHTPAVGWAAGIERLAMLVGEAGGVLEDRPEIVVFCENDGLDGDVILVASGLRRHGIRTEMVTGGSQKKRFEKAQSKNPDMLFVVRGPIESRPNWDPIFVDLKRGRGSPIVDEIVLESRAKEVLESAFLLIPLSRDEQMIADFAVVERSAQ